MLDSISVREYLEIEDIDSPPRDEDFEDCPKMKAWQSVDSFVAEEYGRKRSLGFDAYEKILRGPVDVCPTESGAGQCPARSTHIVN